MATAPPAFRARLRSARLLRSVVDTLRELVDEACVEVVPEEGLRAQALDASHVCLAALTMPCAAFAEWEAGRRVTLGLPLGALATALRCAGADDEVVMEADGVDADGAASMLKLRLAPPADAEAERRSRVTELGLHLVAVAHEAIEVPEYGDEAGRFLMVADDLARVVRDLAGFSDTLGVRLEADEDAVVLVLTCDGAAGRAAMSLRNVDPALPRVSVPSMDFSMRHLTSIVKAAAWSERVVLELVHEMPLSAVFRAGDGLSMLAFKLAPKVPGSPDAHGGGDG